MDSDGFPWLLNARLLQWPFQFLVEAFHKMSVLSLGLSCARAWAPFSLFKQALSQGSLIKLFARPNQIILQLYNRKNIQPQPLSSYQAVL
jgi:hypothetical protein